MIMVERGVTYMKLHYGIVSVASITDRFIHAVQENEDVVEAIASRSYQKALDKAKEYGVDKAYDTYDHIYQDPAVSIVYISVNNGNHVKEIKQALRYGKHVVCEKPIALSQKDAIEIFSLAKEKQCFLMEAQKSIFLPVTQDIKVMIEQQTLGKLHQIELSSSFPEPGSAWFHDVSQGGVVYGSASYTIEYLDYLLSPQSIKVSAMGTKTTSGVCDQVSMNFLFDDVLVNSRITMKGNTLNHAIFYFDNGYVLVPEYWKARSYQIVTKSETKTMQHPCSYEMIYEVAHIHQCIEEGNLQSEAMSEARSVRCCALVDQIIDQLKDL